MDLAGNRRPLEHYIEHAVSILEDYPFQDKQTLVQHLSLVGLDPYRAWEFITFVPIAYFRALLRRSAVRFADTYVLHDDEGGMHTLAFAEQPIYLETLRFAATHFSRGMAQEKVEAVILRSCEFEGVNKRLMGGDPPEEVEVDPPDIWVVEEPSVPEEEAEASTTEEETIEEEEPPQRRWWEFWQ